MTGRGGVLTGMLLPAAFAVLLPAAAELRQPDRGARLETADFRVARRIPDASPGLVALQLDAAVLAHSRGPDARFADVRIVDADGYQLPYLLERRDDSLSLTLAVEPAGSAAARAARGAGSVSVYAIELPHPNLPPARVMLETSARVFRRPVRLGVERGPDRRHRDAWFEPLAAGVWQHADETRAAPPLAMAVTPGDATRLLVVVEEGDNRPLAVTGARLLLPSWRVRFFKPAAPVTLVYGNDAVSPPQYDLALLSERVMSAEARDVTASPDAARPPRPARLSPLLFWVALGLAAVVLLGLIVRLLTSPGS
jgi:hypothetical protein